MISERQLGMAPCLQASAFGAAARRFVETCEGLGESRAADILRAWSVAHLFHERERIFDSQEDPIPAFGELLDRTAHALEGMRESRFTALGAGAGTFELAENVALTTGEHYGQLFRNFSDDSFWKEAGNLLSLRLERNGIPLESVRGRSVLDVGCGGGRYTVAWRLLGAEPALGVDISEINVQDARERVAKAGLSGIGFEAGNVLDLPVANDSFDIVFSNGVLHHTTDWQKGIAELVRTLRKGGLGWLYLIENPGGIFWDSIEILRVVTEKVDRATARVALQVLGIPANRIFYMLDHVMVPINLRLTAEQISGCLADCGAVSIRRLERGADFDRVEKIYQGEPFAGAKYGVGEHRFVFSKA